MKIKPIHDEVQVKLEKAVQTGSGNNSSPIGANSDGIIKGSGATGKP